MLASNLVRLIVTINRNGQPKQVLKDVRSIIEISDEENETLRSISFCNVKDSVSKWVDIDANDFDRITIERHHDFRPRSNNN